MDHNSIGGPEGQVQTDVCGRCWGPRFNYGSTGAFSVTSVCDLTHQLLQECAPKSDNIFDNLPSLSVAKKSAIADEITRYLASPPEATANALLWWVEKEHLYPRLSRMARDYLSIPGKRIYNF